jgi:hypothetical protein
MSDSTPEGFVRHPDEPAYTDRELELARSDENEAALTGDPSKERAVVRREQADLEDPLTARSDGLVVTEDPNVTAARESDETGTSTARETAAAQRSNGTSPDSKPQGRSADSTKTTGKA